MWKACRIPWQFASVWWIQTLQPIRLIPVSFRLLSTHLVGLSIELCRLSMNFERNALSLALSLITEATNLSIDFEMSQKPSTMLPLTELCNLCMFPDAMFLSDFLKFLSPLIRQDSVKICFIRDRPNQVYFSNYFENGFKNSLGYSDRRSIQL